MLISEQSMIDQILRSKRVLLLEPPFPRKYPPLSLAKFSTFCKQNGIEAVYSRQMVYEKFDLILVTTLFTYYSDFVKDIINARGLFHRNTPMIVGGVFASLNPEYFEQFKGVQVYKSYSKVIDLCPPDRSIMDLAEEPWDTFSWVFTSRGCVNKCLHGNTLVNTVLGDIPIRDLVGKEIGVYTYSPESKEVFISKAIHVREMGVKKLVRVWFDDWSFIDCTPDHRFLTFKNGNQYTDLREVEKEAQYLSIGESVRAVKLYTHKQGYKIVSWGRGNKILQHRMVMEYKLKRKLQDEEVVHHKDHRKFNNDPDNLILSANAKEHYRHHPEISERMRNDNPRKFYTEKSLKKMADKIRGQKRGLSTRMKHRERILGKNNPNYTDGHTCGDKSRIAGINHKVMGIEHINNKAMTYDLEVPETGWFFANNVLVHNCAYCAVPRIEKEHWVNPSWKDHIFPDKPNVLISDNNMSAVSYDHLKMIIDHCNSQNKAIMFEGGVDCKYVDPKMAKVLASAKYVRHGLRMAFDRIEEDGVFQTAARNLIDAGVSMESTVQAFLLFNFNDTPQDAYYRGRECFKLGIGAYPMMYRPLNALNKDNPFVGKHWTIPLARAFRYYWMYRSFFKYFTFEEFLKLPETLAGFNLTKPDLDKWYHPTVPFKVSGIKVMRKKK